jgi:hypothetical protein
MPATADFQSVFSSLRGILERQSSVMSIADDSPRRYCLEAPIGPATLKA